MADTRPARQSALLLVNEKARAGTTELTAFIDALDSAGIDCRLERPAGPDEADRLVRELGPATDFVIVGGGDGTISRLLGALLAVGKPVGILPLGTANDFARTLGLQADLGAVAGVIALGATRRVDIGMVGERPFVNVAHLGLGSEIAIAHEGRAKRALGILAYPLHWYRAYRNSRPVSVLIDADGRRLRRRVAQLAVGAGVYYGGGLRVADDAAPDDGLLHLYAIGPRTILGWLRLLAALKVGTLRKTPDATTLSARTIRLEAARRCLIDIDGEVQPFRAAVITVLPGALRVFAPPDAAYSAASAKDASSAGIGPP